ncbi:MAG TPA: hypothetical protein DDY37_08225 [Legionella sp.]|nr:hypothetical protein [Legionella sp.]
MDDLFNVQLNDCPFNAPPYLSGLTHLGCTVSHPTHPFSILKRLIPGTSCYDGVGAWPYICINGPDDLDALRTGFPDMLTITAVTQPGYIPPDTTKDGLVLFKQHYAYDPHLPLKVFSARTMARLQQCEKTTDFHIVTDTNRHLRMADLYNRLKIRRNLTNSYLDFPLSHFEQIAALKNSIFFEVTHKDGIGAIACGVIWGDVLQMLHMACSDDGLKWNASYRLMAGLQAFSEKRHVRLLTGGIPAGGSKGLGVFKARWANTMVPVYLLRIINDHEQYNTLCAKNGANPTYFPAYRGPA